ncbi:hypothetical protein JWE06_22125, partial [Klebsiella pneumoniae]|nr:hypothetical protein [Klebsiella pneumoniae]
VARCWVMAKPRAILCCERLSLVIWRSPGASGANYNIGKIYEGEGQYNEALNYYKAAKNEKQNPVYDNAILRVSSKIN